MAKNSLVYRLEHSETRRGCYNTREAYTAINSLFSINEERHPLPSDDSVFMKRSRKLGNPQKDCRWGSHRFCFASVAQLRAWFYNDAIFSKLQAQGIVLSIYSVPAKTLVKGSTQSAFPAEHHKDENIRKQYNLSEWVSKGFCKK